MYRYSQADQPPDRGCYNSPAVRDGPSVWQLDGHKKPAAFRNLAAARTNLVYALLDATVRPRSFQGIGDIGSASLVQAETALPGDTAHNISPKSLEARP